MPVELRMPQLGEAAAAARLAAWLKAEGEAVAAGEPIAEVETDKTNVEIESPASGVVREICVAAGTEGLQTGALLAVIAEAGDAEAAAEAVEPAARAAPPPGPEVQPVEVQPVDAQPVDTPPVSDPPPASDPSPAPDVLPAPDAPPAPVLGGPDARAAASPAGGTTPPATPLARRMAAAAGLDLGRIRGTGWGGRIGKDDVERALAGQAPARAPAVAAPPAVGEALPAADPGHPPQAPAAAANPSAAAGTTRGVEPGPPRPAPPAGWREEALPAPRRVTAERLQAAKREVPHFYLRVDCAVDAALQLRARVNAQQPGLHLTLTGILVRAAALALRQVPAANSSWAGDRVRLYEAADVAVAVDTPRGLLTPVIRRADTKGLRAIAEELRALAARAREGSLRPEEYSGGTFTISNLGMYGVDSLYAIVNPPQSGILGVGAARPRPVVEGGAVRVATLAACTLSADHRAIDGATGARLLAAVRTFVEEPGLLAL